MAKIIFAAAVLAGLLFGGADSHATAKPDFLIDPAAAPAAQPDLLIGADAHAVAKPDLLVGLDAINAPAAKPDLARIKAGR